jgi:hypothetical protein
MTTNPDRIRLALDIPIRYLDSDRSENIDPETLGDNAREVAHAAPGFDSVEDLLSEMEVVGTVSDDEWIEFFSDEPAEEIAGVPDSATHYVCWERKGAQQSVSIYANDNAYWVVSREGSDVTVEEGGLAGKNALEHAAELQAEMSELSGRGLDELSLWYVLPHVGAAGKTYLLDTADEAEARAHLEEFYAGEIEELRYERTLGSALSDVFESGTALLAE